MANSGNLHLPDLAIKGFRGIDELTIRKLGRVTLLAGKNGIGKTTVLDAVKAYAARGRIPVLYSILEKRGEFSVATDKDGDIITFPDLSAFFHGRVLSPNMYVSVGLKDGKDALNIEAVSLDSLGEAQDSILATFPNEVIQEEKFLVLKITYQKQEQIAPLLVSFDNERAYALTNFALAHRLTREYGLPAVIKCVSLGPGLMSNDEISNLWDSVVLTPDESLAVRSLSLIFGPVVTRAAMVSDNRISPQHTDRHRVIVKLANQDRPVPLQSLGDGATRLFTVALALANSRDGFLLIDEAENGIHHSVQANYWRLVLQTAQDNNVQVLVTTHSWDCVRGFAQAAVENEAVEGVLVRLQRNALGLRAVEYSEEDLQIAAEQNIEVR